jgi:hypothetical protein
VSRGWPPHIAFNLDDSFREAFVIQLIEMYDGGSYDFDNNKWKETPKGA